MRQRRGVRCDPCRYFAVPPELRHAVKETVVRLRSEGHVIVGYPGSEGGGYEYIGGPGDD